MPVTAGQLLQKAAEEIRGSEAIELWRPYMGRLEAEALLATVLRHPVTNPEETVTPAAQRRFEDLVRSYGIIELVKTGRIALGRGERGIKDRQLRAAV